jgi:hypothetical protein
MVALSGIPFRFRSQSWESAPDGSGFGLGAAAEQVAGNSTELDALLQEVTTKVHIAEPTPVPDPPGKEELLSDILRGASTQWSDLTLLLFRRGEGDVEHVAIVGVEPASGKVAGLYVN